MSDLINGTGAMALLLDVAITRRQLPGADFFIVVGVIALAIGFVGFLGIYVAVRHLRVRSELRRNGVTVEGRITGRRFDRRSKWWKVTYSYDYQGQPYSHEQDVRKKYYLALSEGTAVLVHCLAHDPSVARVVDPKTTRIIHNPDEFWYNIAFKFYGGILAIVVVLLIVRQVLGVFQ